MRSDNTWYCPDLVNRIIKSKPGHELATHTFSHIDFSDDNCDTELARAEIAACKRAMSGFDLVPRSIVFPGGFWGNFKALSEEGITAFRRREKFDLSYPIKSENDLWNIPQSMFLFVEDFVGKSIRYMVRAMETNTVCHMAFHPSKLNGKRLEKIFIPILKFADKHRKSGKLWISTMGGLANYCEAREKTVVKSRTDGTRLEVHLRHDMDLTRYEAAELTFKIKMPDGKTPHAVKAAEKVLEIGSDNCKLKQEKQQYLLVTIPADGKKIIVEFN
jgi:hypothetical protein